MCRPIRSIALSVPLLLAVVSFAAVRPGAAADTPTDTPAWLHEVTLNGFLATSYSHGGNHPASGTNQFRVFDFDDATFKVDVFELVLQKPAAAPKESGFRVDLAAGSSIPRVSAAAGLFRDASGTAGDLDLQQAFASYVAPVGSGLHIDAGKFVTHHGYEVIPGYDGWNEQATRSFLFGFAIPFTHTGARASYAFSPRASGMLTVGNGWDVARDNNRAKSVGGQFTFAPTPALTVILNGMAGPERTGDNQASRRLFDLIAVWKAGARITIGANADWGTEEDALAPGQDADWRGFAGYARFAPGGRFAISARAERFEDMDGVRTGVAQRLAEFTVTPEARLTPHLLVRADLRADHSNHDVFEKRLAFADTQPTVLLEALFSF